MYRVYKGTKHRLKCLDLQWSNLVLKKKWEKFCHLTITQVEIFVLFQDVIPIFKFCWTQPKLSHRTKITTQTKEHKDTRSMASLITSETSTNNHKPHKREIRHTSIKGNKNIKLRLIHKLSAKLRKVVHYAVRRDM